MAIQRQGYYENGVYHIKDTASIPSERTRITVIFHNVDNKTQDKTNVIKDILADALKAENGLSDTEWDDMTNLRAYTNTGLSRNIEL
ncbi:MAG: hypothetical protein LBS19_16110 [Clostridiales bacterium]|nr:hypothetical protein [Clostridiales bacterium]